MKIIEMNKKRIEELCKMHNVARLYLFGSAITTDFKEESDIDLLVDFKKIDLIDYADNYFDFKYSLQILFNREVDLLENQAIRNPYLKHNIDNTKKLIYG
jgi:uncharacterized protein